MNRFFEKKLDEVKEVVISQEKTIKKLEKELTKANDVISSLTKEITNRRQNQRRRHRHRRNRRHHPTPVLEFLAPSKAWQAVGGPGGPETSAL